MKTLLARVKINIKEAEEIVQLVGNLPCMWPAQAQSIAPYIIPPRLPRVTPEHRTRALNISVVTKKMFLHWYQI